MLVVITIFIAICFAMVGVYSMGIVPTIFDTKEETTNQTKLIIDYFEGQNKLMIDQFHRENNTTQKLLIGLNDSLIKEDQALRNQGVMIKAIKVDQDMNRVIAKQIFNVSKQHEIVAKDHNKLQLKVDNMTQDIYDLLESADNRNYEVNTYNKKILDNITKVIEDLKSVHQEILNKLDSP
jgi:Fe2+ transport system protein B